MDPSNVIVSSHGSCLCQPNLCVCVHASDNVFMCKCMYMHMCVCVCLAGLVFAVSAGSGVMWWSESTAVENSTGHRFSLVLGVRDIIKRGVTVCVWLSLLMCVSVLTQSNKPPLP